MKRIQFGAVIVAAALSAAWLDVAKAADLPLKAPVPMVAPQYNWTGFYIGVQGGYGWGWPQFDLPFPVYLQQQWPANGGFGGGMIGANYEFGASHVVVGLEGEWSGADLSGKTVDPFGFAHSSTLNEFGSIDGRLGFALTGYAWDHIMLYIVGGAAFGDPKQTVTTPTGTASFSGGDKTGYDFGAGVEYGVTANWTLRGEWRMYGFTTSSYGANVVVPIAYGAKETVNVARFGVAYKF
jgi:outer membrane immunogenic protein